MRIFSFLLLLIIIFSALSGCNSDITNTKDTSAEGTDVENKTTDLPIEYDTESIITLPPNDTHEPIQDPTVSIGTEPTETSNDKTSNTVTEKAEDTTQQTIIVPPSDDKKDGFIVKGKKYNYDGKNVLILNVENTTSKNYSVSVSVEYSEASGKTINIESQKFDGFAAGYKKYFLFEPGITFDSYTYKVTAEEYTGECYAQNIDIWFGELYERLTYRVDKHDDYTKYPTILARCYYKNSSSNNLMVSYNFILIDNTGEIFVILKSGSLFEPGAKGDGYNTLCIDQFLEGDLIWPEELKGDVSAICAIENVTLYEK